MERQSLRSELREHLYRPLWGSRKQSPASLDGVVRCFPSESPVGPLTRPTGLSRAQQLIIFNTLKILFLPSFSRYNGGFALDRAIPLIGTPRWWSALLVRVKAQQCIRFGGPRLIDKLKNLGDGDNYSISLRSKARLSSRTSFETSIEADKAASIQTAIRRETSSDRRWEGIGGRVEFTHKFDIYKLIVGCAFREKLQTQGGSLFLPALLSTEVVSNNLHSPFHYRVGLHQILDVFPGCSDVVHECNNGTYFQGGMGIDGVLTLLKTPRIRTKKSTKQQRLDQMRETKLTDLSFDRSLSDSRNSLGSTDWLTSTARQRTNKNGTLETEALVKRCCADISEWPSADSVLEQLRSQTASLQKSAQQLSKAAEDVNEGKLKDFNKQLEKKLMGKRKGLGHAFLPSPHLKIGGLAGIVASFGFHKDGLERMGLSEGGHTSPALRRRASLRWRSPIEDHPVKAFLGCSFSAQIGRMRRRFLSFTSALMHSECTIPIAFEQTSLPRRIQSIAATHRRNLMIGNVFGPLRAKADYRVALESSYAIGSMSNINPGSAFIQQLQSIRPCIVDAQFGFDFVIPGMQGAIKFGGWYSPSKKEAMAELRLF